jgi:predicted GIY-YIG superfamily endonuclease
MGSTNNIVYVLHFEQKYKHAQHYIGTTKDLDSRYQQHITGQGSPLVRAVVAAGIGVVIAATYPGGRKVERKMKNRHKASTFCPICKQQRKEEQ